MVTGNSKVLWLKKINAATRTFIDWRAEPINFSDCIIIPASTDQVEMLVN